MRCMKDHNKKYRVSVGPQFACSLFQHDQTTLYTARGKEDLVRRINSDYFILIFGDIAWPEIILLTILFVLHEGLCV